MLEIDAHLRLPREEAVFTHFGPLVVCEQAAELSRQRSEFEPKVCRTVAASFAFRGTSKVNHMVRSTSIPSADALAWPMSKSPSQCPGTVRSATSVGRSSMLIRSWIGRDDSRTLRGRQKRCHRRRYRTSSRLNALRGST